MSSNYTSQDILKMAVKLIEADMAADLDGDGKVTTSDARLALRREKGLDGAGTDKNSSDKSNVTDKSGSGGSAAVPNKSGSAGAAGGGNKSNVTGITETAKKIDGTAQTKEENIPFLQGEKPYEYVPDEGLSLMSSSILDKILNYQSADFDINSDKLYNQYRDMYAKNASLSAENTFGLASAFTGGYGNSYAASAASAAYNSYMSSLQDKALEIEELYNSRQKEELSNLYKALEAVNKLEEKNYSRYQDNLSLAFDAAKQGDYSLLQSLGFDISKLKQADILEKAETAAKYGDYSILQSLGIDTSRLKNSEALKNAETAAKYGDYSLLQNLGYDTSRLTNAEALEKAVTAAKYGDYSYLKRLGINTSSLLEKEQLEKAIQAAEYGDYSYLSSLGINTDFLRYNELLKTASAIAEYGDYSALELLGVDVSSLIENDQFERALELAKYGDYSLLGSFSNNLSGMKQKISATIQKGAQEAYTGGGYSALVSYLNKQVGYGQINESAKKQIISVVTGGKYGG